MTQLPSRELKPRPWQAAVLILIAAVGCGDGGEAAPEAPEWTGLPFDPSTAGDVRGIVRFEGTPPELEPLDLSGFAACAEPGGAPPELERIRVGDGGLADAFVHVKEGLEHLDFPLEQEPVVLEVRGCRIVPRVAGMMVNQTLTFRNEDPLRHDLRAEPEASRPFEVQLPTQGREMNRTLSRAEVAVPIRCGVHPWMQGWVGVVTHPYRAVTDERGEFTLEGLPPGEYLIEAWHPELGVREAEVIVTTGETAEVSITWREVP